MGLDAGTGFYTDDIDAVIAEMKESSNAALQSSLTATSFCGLIALVVAVFAVAAWTGPSSEAARTVWSFN